MGDVPLRDAAQAVVDARDLRAKRFQQMGRHPVGVADYHAAAAALESAIEALRAALAAADTAQCDASSSPLITPPVSSWTCVKGRRIGTRQSSFAGEDAGECPCFTAGAAADGTTPTQSDEVLWHTVTTAPGSPLGEGLSWLEIRGVAVPVPPGTAVRVVATPTTEPER